MNLNFMEVDFDLSGHYSVVGLLVATYKISKIASDFKKSKTTMYFRSF